MRGRALIIATSHYSDPQLANLPLPGIDLEGLRETLVDPRIGDFDVEECAEETWQEWRVRLDDFFGEASRDELLLLYIAGHAVKGRDRKLYFAASNTRLNRLLSTGINAAFIQEVLYHSPSRRVITILDTCFSGAFAKGGNIRADAQAVNVAEYFRNDAGRVVITASDSIHHALVGELVETLAQPALLCRHIVEGLRSGLADIDNDGQVTSQELFTYVSGRLASRRPQRWAFGLEGDLVLAANPLPRPVKLEEPAANQEDLPAASQTERQMQAVDRLLRSIEAESVPLARVAEALERMLVDDGRPLPPAEPTPRSAAQSVSPRSAQPTPALQGSRAPEARSGDAGVEPAITVLRVREAQPSEPRVEPARRESPFIASRTGEPAQDEPRINEPASSSRVSELRPTEHREPRLSEARPVEDHSSEQRVTELRPSGDRGRESRPGEHRAAEPWLDELRSAAQPLEHGASDPPASGPWSAGDPWTAEHRAAESRSEPRLHGDPWVSDAWPGEDRAPLRPDAPVSEEARSSAPPLDEPHISELGDGDFQVIDALARELRVSDARDSELGFSGPGFSEEPDSEAGLHDTLLREPRVSSHEPRRSELRVDDMLSTDVRPRLTEARVSEPRVPNGSEFRSSDPLTRDLRLSEALPGEPRVSEPRGAVPEVNELWISEPQVERLRSDAHPGQPGELWTGEPLPAVARNGDPRMAASSRPMTGDGPPRSLRGRPARGWMALGSVWLVACLVLWLAQLSQTPPGLNAVSFANDGLHGWAVGEHGTVQTTADGGESWNTVTTPAQSNLNSVYFAEDALHGWAIGQGELIQTVDGGQTWTSADIPTREILNSVCFASDGKHGWAVGVNGTVIATADGGQTWFVQGSPVRANLSSVYFTADGEHGWAVGEAGTVIATADGGNDWEAQASPTRMDLDSVYFTSDGERGWAVGAARFEFAVVIATLDGGRTWQVQTSPTRSDLNSVYFAADGEHGWAVGGRGAVIATSDGGQIWDLQSSPVRSDLNSVYFEADGSRGWAVGAEGAVIATADGGDTWIDAESSYRRSQALWFGLAMLPAFGMFTLGRRRRRAPDLRTLSGLAPGAAIGPARRL